jgi:hypothetical protein
MIASSTFCVRHALHYHAIDGATYQPYMLRRFRALDHAVAQKSSPRDRPACSGICGLEGYAPMAPFRGAISIRTCRLARKLANPRLKTKQEKGAAREREWAGKMFRMSRLEVWAANSIFLWSYTPRKKAARAAEKNEGCHVKETQRTRH